VPWSARFTDPIVLPYGRRLNTLRNAASYITALPKTEADAAEWQPAMETLLVGRRTWWPGNDGPDRGAAGAESKSPGGEIGAAPEETG
jgi:hypothetical protein